MIYVPPSAEIDAASPRPGPASAASTKRICILVLGMHRSGTSAFTRVLNLMGATLPVTTIQADTDNPAGYWEPTSLNSLDEALLAEAGSSWRDWNRLSLSGLRPDRLVHYKNEIRRLIELEFGDSQLFVIKDPRICRLVPVYREVLENMGVVVRPVLVSRNPLAVAASLEARDSLSLAASELYWLRHTLDAERDTRDLPRAFASYEDLLADWQTVVGQIGDDIRVNWPREAEAAAVDVEDFLDHSHEHNRVSFHDLVESDLVAEFVKRTYGALASHDDAALSSAFDTIAAEIDFAIATSERDPADVIVSIAAKTSRLRQLERDANVAAAQADDLSRQLGGLWLQLSERDEALKQSSVSNARIQADVASKVIEIDALRRSTSWRITAPVRAVKKLIDPRWLFRRGVDALRAAFVRMPLSSSSKLAIKALAMRNSSIRNAIGQLASQPSATPVFHRKPGGINVGTPDETTLLRDYREQVLSLPLKAKGTDLQFVPKIEEAIDFSRSPLSIVAFYLPQFHPIPENNEWWGSGFTEWTNVSKAVPQYIDHYQPHIPGELGFYDLRLPEVMRQQAELAKNYGIGAFCFHHYWFGGKRLLERPVEQFLKSPDIDIKFCLSWANENWTRRWDGQDHEILIAQKHSPEDDVAFIDDVIPAFLDKRYLRYQDKPILIVYRATLLPDPAATAERWRSRARQAGIEDLYLVAAQTFGIQDPRPFGFDAAVEFPPHAAIAGEIKDRVRIANPNFAGKVYAYADLAQSYGSREQPRYPVIKTISPGWDNEARRPGAGHNFHGSTPALYAKWLRAVLATTAKAHASGSAPPIVFVNAWNEWAEGAHLEPDRRFGYAYLHATANVMRDIVTPDVEFVALVENSQAAFSKRSDEAVLLHLHYEEMLDQFAAYIGNVPVADVMISLPRNTSAQTARRVLSAFPQARLSFFRNRGRDIYPFLEHLPLILDLGYERVCKIHSKKSPHRLDGTSLRVAALEALLGSAATVQKIREQFESRPDVAIVAPPESILELGILERNILNRRWLDQLYGILDLSSHVGNYRGTFAAGSMFWFRPIALRRLVDLRLGPDQFEDELGQVDATLAHAIERLFGTLVEQAGFTSIQKTAGS